MSSNSASIHHEKAAPAPNSHVEANNNIFEENIALGTRDNASIHGGHDSIDRVSAADPHTPSGRLKAWSYVLAAFFIFISVW